MILNTGDSIIRLSPHTSHGSVVLCELLMTIDIEILFVNQCLACVVEHGLTLRGSLFSTQEGLRQQGAKFS